MYINLRVPVILLILAATAIPVELGPPTTVGLSVQPIDVLQNILGYLPVGMALAGLTAVHAIAVAATVSVLAESGQFIMVHRDPSVVDVAANVFGAGLGFAVAVLCRLHPHLLLRRWMSFTAIPLMLAMMAIVAWTAAAPPSPRGASAPGTLEARWQFDEPGGDTALDSSPHRLNGTVHHGARRVPGMNGGAIAFDGANGYVDAGRPGELRLTGSLTVSAWINARANPVDDAVIVSTIGRAFGGGQAFGFQLDTTVDRGPRTIGFKMGDVCGSQAARYGATALQLDTWYYVTGVYDAQAMTLNVYLNGNLDNGELRGEVPAARRSSRERLHIGTRSKLRGFEFAGTIDDVRIYSRGLTQDEIVADMNGSAAALQLTDAHATEPQAAPAPSVVESRCSWSAEPEDARLPLAAAATGTLLGVAMLGLPGAWRRTLALVLGAGSGFLLYTLATPTLPAFNAWSFSLTSLVAAACLIASVRHSPPERFEGVDSTRSSQASRQSG